MSYSLAQACAYGSACTPLAISGQALAVKHVAGRMPDEGRLTVFGLGVCRRVRLPRSQTRGGRWRLLCACQACMSPWRLLSTRTCQLLLQCTCKPKGSSYNNTVPDIYRCDRMAFLELPKNFERSPSPAFFEDMWSITVLQFFSFLRINCHVS